MRHCTSAGNSFTANATRPSTLSPMSNFLTILSPFLVAQLFRRAGQPGDRFGMIFSIALCLFGWTPVERRASEVPSL